VTPLKIFKPWGMAQFSDHDIQLMQFHNYYPSKSSWRTEKMPYYASRNATAATRMARNFWLLVQCGLSGVSNREYAWR
jgi:hypothetical protein